MTSPLSKRRLVKTPPGLLNYPLLDDIHTIVPMPLITYAEPELGDEFKPNACRLTRDVTRQAPSFDSYPLCFTLPASPDSFDSFITAMRSTVNWLAHKKGSTGRPVAKENITNQDLSIRTVGPTKVHDYTWTFHCPSFGHPRVKPGVKPNPFLIHSFLQSPTCTTEPPPGAPSTPG